MRMTVRRIRSAGRASGLLGVDSRERNLGDRLFIRKPCSKGEAVVRKRGYLCCGCRKTGSDQESLARFSFREFGSRGCTGY